MRTRIIIKNIPYNDLRNQNENDAFVFFLSSWNDYGYNITFDVYYYSNEGKEQYIGAYRVYNHSIENNETKSTIRHVSEQILQDSNVNDGISVPLTVAFNNNYLSLAVHISFYQNLYNILQNGDNYNEFLSNLRDVTVVGLPEEFKENKVVENTLLRNDGITKSGSILVLNDKLKQLDKSLNVANYPFTDYIFNCIVEKQEDLEKIREVVSDSVRETSYSYDLLSNLVSNYKNGNFNDKDLKIYSFLSTILSSTLYFQLKSNLDSCVDDSLRTVLENVTAIKDELRYGSDDKNFIHYTSLGTLNFLLPNKSGKSKSDNSKDSSYPRLRLSNARQMNDPNEGYTLLNLLGVSKKELPVTDYETSSFYFASMSQTGDGKNLEDSLPMWKQYGDDAKGVNLTYHSNYIQRLVNDGIEIYRVCYNVSEENEELREVLENLKREFAKIKQENKQKIFFSALRLIDSIRYLFKEKDYSYENEFRIIKSYEGKEHEIFPFENANSVIPGLYVYLDEELKYSKIKLGPKCGDIDFIAPYIKYVDPDIEVTRSEISYR